MRVILLLLFTLVSSCFFLTFLASLDVSKIQAEISRLNSVIAQLKDQVAKAPKDTPGMSNTKHIKLNQIPNMLFSDLPYILLINSLFL